MAQDRSELQRRNKEQDVRRAARALGTAIDKGYKPEVIAKRQAELDKAKANLERG